jgi:hypothetical protein
MVSYEQKTATFHYSLQKYNWIILALESVVLCLYFKQQAILSDSKVK